MRRYGPDSQEVKDEIIKVDSLLGNFFQDLESQGVLDDTDVIIVSDHGIYMIIL